MSLTRGALIGSYEVLSLLGAGGMGEVYRARDTKLDRDVALKILPESFAGDPDRLARFEREAKVLAALNHPHIAAIYGVEDSGGTNALVLELVEGQTLADRLAEGPIPLPEALALADQIQLALAAAHERGIIHRDLKPANVKITPDGTVKVLDFGLARLVAPSSVQVDVAPTISVDATHAGVILGTAAYMAPEQARGKPVDQRADIWAFGVVLYEMVTGRGPFARDTLTDTVAAIIESDVNVEVVPAAIRRLVRACLQKDARQRLQDVRDAKLLIDAEPTADTQPVAVRARRALLAWMAAAGLLLIAASALAIVHFGEPPPVSPQPTRFEIVTPPLETGADFYMAMAPDGRRLAFTARGEDGLNHLWIRDMDKVEARLLPGTERARSLFWSPDSRFVGFAQDNRLRRVDASGGTPPSTVCELNLPVGMGTWSREDVILFASRGNGTGIWRVSAAGGTPQVVTRSRKDQLSHTYPVFLPDGRHFIYLGRSVSPDVIGIYSASLDVAPEQQPTSRIVATANGAAYVPPAGGEPGQLLFVRDNTLLMQPFDVERRVVTGQPTAVVESIGTAASTGFFAASANALAYRTGQNAYTQLAWYDRTGQLLDSGQERRFQYTGVGLSPDGQRVVTSFVENPGGVWVTDLRRNQTIRVTFDTIDRLPVWSPDGAEIAFASAPTANDPVAIYRVAADGSGQPQLLLKATEPSTSFAPLDWSRDGQILVVAQGAKTLGRDLYIYRTGERRLLPFRVTRFDEALAKFSPDGRWVVYRSNDSGVPEIYVRPVPSSSQSGATHQRIVSSGGGLQARWSADGKEIIYLSPDNRFMSVAVTTSGETIQVNPPKALLSVPQNARLALQGDALGWDIADNAQRFLLNLTPVDIGSHPITILQNWRNALKPG